MDRRSQKTIFLIVSAVLIVVSGIFLLSQIDKWSATVANNEEAMLELAQIQNQLDESALNQERDSIASNLANKKSELEKIVEDAMSSGAVNTRSRNTASTHSEYHLNLLSALYEQTSNIELLPTLFQLSLDFRKFDQALDYLLVLQSQTTLSDQISMNQYLYALFNSAQLDFGQINRLKQIVDEYLEQNLITQADHTLYYSHITLIKNDLENYKLFMQQLRWTAYTNLASSYDAAMKRADSFVDTPDYYLQWLLGISVFNQWRYRIAQKIATSLKDKDRKYLLAYQLDAYASVMLWDRSQATAALDFLIKNDQPNQELYNYLLWLSFYYDEKHTDAILAFSQLKSQKYNADVLRYSLLSYGLLDDSSGAVNTIRILSNKENLNIYDYFAVFDEVFFSPKKDDYIDQLWDQLDLLFKKCYVDMEWDQIYACLYGKSWLYLALWDTQTAYQYLQRVVQRYPKTQLYEYLWDLAIQLWDDDQATKRYIQWLLSTTVLDDQELLKNKVKELMK